MRRLRRAAGYSWPNDRTATGPVTGSIPPVDYADQIKFTEQVP